VCTQPTAAKEEEEEADGWHSASRRMSRRLGAWWLNRIERLRVEWPLSLSTQGYNLLDTDWIILCVVESPALMNHSTTCITLILRRYVECSVHNNLITFLFINVGSKQKAQFFDCGWQ
jgi:hypothetical protein